LPSDDHLAELGQKLALLEIADLLAELGSIGSPLLAGLFRRRGINILAKISA